MAATAMMATFATAMDRRDGNKWCNGNATAIAAMDGATATAWTA